MPGMIGCTYTRNVRPTGRVIFSEYRRWWWFRRKPLVILEIEEEWEVQHREAPAIYPLPEDKWVRRARWREAQPIDLCDLSLHWIHEGKKN